MLARFGPTGLRFADSGGPASNTDVLVVKRNTATPADLYTDRTGALIGDNPLRTDAYGNLSFWVAAGNYDLLINGGRIPIEVSAGAAESVEQLLLDHILAPNPHPTYDRIPSLVLLAENRLI